MSKDIECAAVRYREELRALRRGKGNPLLTTPYQSIGGVVVPTPTGQSVSGLNDPNRPYIVQKASLGTSDFKARPLSISPGVEISETDPQSLTTGTASFKNYSNFDSSAPTDSSALPSGYTKTSALQPGFSSTTARMAQTSNTPEGNKMRVTQSGILYALHMIREPVVEYQETRGVPRNEEITFLTLVTSLCTQAYTAAITILVMLWNLMPLVDGLVYFVRFFLDKVIDIVQTDDNKDRAIKAAILFGELIIITFIIFLIVGLIFMPVYVLMARLFSKIFSMIAW